MKTDVKKNVMTRRTLKDENPYLAEAKRRIQLLRIMGLCDGPINVTVEDVEEWIRQRSDEPAMAQLDEYAAHQIQDFCRELSE